jgi:hypothetical protein
MQERNGRVGSLTQGHGRQAYSLCMYVWRFIAPQPMQSGIFLRPRQALTQARQVGGSSIEGMADPRQYRDPEEAKISDPELNDVILVKLTGFRTVGDLIVEPSLGIDLYKVVPIRRLGGSICVDRGVSAGRCMDRADRYATSYGMALGSRVCVKAAACSVWGKWTTGNEIASNRKFKLCLVIWMEFFSCCSSY